jgi:hypothetical protein
VITPDRFERELPELFDELAAARTPDYFDDIVQRSERMRQRPAWTFPERWLPMSALTTRMATAPRPSWRLVGLAALLIIGLVLGALALAGSQRRLPAPFGPAGNGVIPYVANGDLYVGDLATGTSRLLVGGPEEDALPQFSPDGTRVAFIRTVKSGSDDPPIDLYVVNADGSGLKRITSQPIAHWQWIGWMPDGRHLAVVHPDVINQLDLYDASGGGQVNHIAAASGLDSLQFRPPDGREVLLDGQINGSYGLYAMNADGTNVHPVLLSTDPASDDYWGGATYSADGSQIFYTRPYQHQSPTGTCCALWVMNADGSDQHEFIPNPGDAWDGGPVVSPDGSKVAFWNGYVSVVRADGTGPVIQTGPKPTGTVHWVWAPDSSKILMYPNDDSSTSAYVLDPAGGPWTTVPWRSDGDLDWQRVAP